ncbi:hypothetical protein [Streptomyces litchfieldiae]|uniref:Oxidoreductase n=1 Tax=Streptomyces litchfieldiae TaxID=3075543 RepID=A0ABU2N130_9ACTN|nr:hypothetical protein [Streptomyces sp. DSM 44938]MDT0347621.1 hypothetical protein [Streptomyces sp. DSM 44938]
MIANVAGPGAPLSLIHWDDLGLTRSYDGQTAMFQAGKLNDLLGLSFAERRETRPIRYVLWHPGATATGLVGDYDETSAAHVATLKRHGKPASVAAARIAATLDDPPAEPLSAFVETRRIAITPATGFDASAARRLETLTEDLLAPAVRPTERP